MDRVYQIIIAFLAAIILLMLIKGKISGIETAETAASAEPTAELITAPIATPTVTPIPDDETAVVTITRPGPTPTPSPTNRPDGGIVLKAMKTAAGADVALFIKPTAGRDTYNTYEYTAFASYGGDEYEVENVRYDRGLGTDYINPSIVLRSYSNGVAGIQVEHEGQSSYNAYVLDGGGLRFIGQFGGEARESYGVKSGDVEWDATDFANIPWDISLTARQFDVIIDHYDMEPVIMAAYDAYYAERGGEDDRLDWPRFLEFKRRGNNTVHVTKGGGRDVAVLWFQGTLGVYVAFERISDPVNGYGEWEIQFAAWYSSRIAEQGRVEFGQGGDWWFVAYHETSHGTGVSIREDIWYDRNGDKVAQYPVDGWEDFLSLEQEDGTWGYPISAGIESHVEFDGTDSVSVRYDLSSEFWQSQNEGAATFRFPPEYWTVNVKTGVYKLEKANFGVEPTTYYENPAWEMPKLWAYSDYYCGLAKDAGIYSFDSGDDFLRLMWAAFQ